MPNTVGPTGLTIKTRAEVLDELINGTAGFPGFLSIYGSDINLDPNTPDGNLLNLLAQLSIDYEEYCQQVYTSFDPSQAVGVNLDRDCAINGVVRHAGTFTTQLVAVTVTQALTLPGLDTFPDAPFTVSDSAGNRFNLIAAYAFGGAATASLLFQSEKLGAVIVASNTLTVVATPTLGVSGVTNGTLAGTLGINEETDAALRRRRAISVSIPSQGYVDGLIAALLAVDDVTDAQVFENDTDATVGTIPENSIWAIVAGGANEDIAQTIYVKRSMGCGMKGSVSVNITQLNGVVIAILFDRPVAETLWISFNLTAITGSIDTTYVKNQLLAALSYRIGQAADASAITALVKAIEPNAYVDTMGVSDTNGSYLPYKTTTDVNYQWAVATSRILINGI